MRLQYFVTKADSGEQVLIAMEPAMKNDLEATKNGWQSDWTSDFISDPRLEKYAAKTEAGEIVALGAYREDDHGISVFIADIEAQPESNPTLTKKTPLCRCRPNDDRLWHPAFHRQRAR